MCWICAVSVTSLDKASSVPRLPHPIGSQMPRSSVGDIFRTDHGQWRLRIVVNYKNLYGPSRETKELAQPDLELVRATLTSEVPDLLERLKEEAKATQRRGGRKRHKEEEKELEEQAEMSDASLAEALHKAAAASSTGAPTPSSGTAPEEEEQIPGPPYSTTS